MRVDFAVVRSAALIETGPPARATSTAITLSLFNSGLAASNLACAAARAACLSSTSLTSAVCFASTSGTVAAFVSAIVILLQLRVGSLGHQFQVFQEPRPWLSGHSL